MKSSFTKSMVVCSTLLLALLVVSQWASVLPVAGNAGFLREVVAQVRGRNAFMREGNGYYENLMEHRKSPGAEAALIQWIIHGKTVQSENYRDGGFLIYEGRPGLSINDPSEGPIATNSYGFFDREHSLEKPAGTRRIAIFGDSVARGVGVAMDERFGNLLENRLNAQPGERFEVLNFAVAGYRLTQMYDSALEKAPAFHPDVCILALTEATASPNWGDHIQELLVQDRDLKYDLIRRVVKESKLGRWDSPGLSAWKLAPFREPTLRTILLHLKGYTEQQSASLIVFLVPTAEDQYMTDHRFRALREVLDGTSIPVVDLTDTFNGIDIDPLRLNWSDHHPNSAGHHMIADNLYNKLLRQPAAWTAITGRVNYSQSLQTACLRRPSSCTNRLAIR